MNIIRFTKEFPPYDKIATGLAPLFYNLSKEQVNLGVKVNVICGRNPNEKKFEEIEGIQVHRVTKPYSISALSKIIELRKHSKIDLVHTHGTSNFLYAFSRTIFRKLGISHVGHVHGTTLGILTASYKYVPTALRNIKLSQNFTRVWEISREKVMWNWADALIAVSKSVEDELTDFYRIEPARINIVSTGVDTKIFSPRKSRKRIIDALGLPVDCRIILYLGGFRFIKGPSFFVKALQLVKKTIPNFRAVFAGNTISPTEAPYVNYVMSLVNTLGIKDCLQFINYISHESLSEYYSAADVIVVPSVYDSFPKVILEAMACNTPVVASSIGGPKQLINDGETGFLASPSSSKELAQAIVKALLDRNLTETITTRAKKMVNEAFTWHHIAKKCLRIYQSIEEP